MLQVEVPDSEAMTRRTADPAVDTLTKTSQVEMNAVDPNDGDLVPTLVVLPFFLLIAGWIIVSRFFDKYKKKFANSISKRAIFEKDRVWTITKVCEILLITVCVEAADFSDLADGNLDVGSFCAIMLLPLPILLYVFTSKLERYYEKQKRKAFEDTTVKALRDETGSEKLRRNLANQQYLIADSMREFHVHMGESEKDKLTFMRERIEKRLQENVSKGKPRISIIRPAEFLKLAAPIPNAQSLVVAVAQQSLELRRPREGGLRNKVRASLFETKGTALDAVASFNGKRESIVLSPSKYKHEYEITNFTRCLAVKAAFSHSPEIVPDAAAGNSDLNCSFIHYDASQANKIRSIAAIPIRFDRDTEAHARYVLCVDCNRSGYFTEGLKEEFDFLAEFSKERLEFASVMDELYQCLFLNFGGA